MELRSKYTDAEEAIDLGNKTSFNIAFRSYFHPLRFYATKFVPDDDAEDVVENLFLKLWSKKKVFDSAAHLQAFLYHATRNSCLDVIKLSKKGKTDPLSEEMLIADDDHLRYMIQAEALAEIYRAVNELPLQCSKVTRMSYLEGLNNAEIAEELGLSVQTVKNYKNRGIELLRKKLSAGTFALFLLIFHS